MRGVFKTDGSLAKPETIFSDKFLVKEFNLESIKNISFTPISPPQEEVEFKFGQREYEVPEKK